MTELKRQRSSRHLAASITQSLHQLRGSSRPMFSPAGQPWMPPADVFEYADRVLIQLEVPGIADRQVILLQEGTLLLVEGERCAPDLPTPEACHSVEIQYGMFSRVFDFPDPLDIATAQAAYDGGFLTLMIPKCPRPAQQGAASIRIRF